MDRRRKVLPTQAKEFLSYCDAVHKKTTVSTYTTSLRKLYFFLKENGKEPEDFFKYIDRAILEKWFTSMYEAGLAPASRFLCLMNIRCYFKWAYDREYLKQNPELLIRRSDFPKKPKYLPKPLEPEHDQKLIEYLKTSNQFSEKGLLLLRWGGMRVGELLNMPWNCLHQEDDGTSSIYIPPGKMYNDRYVPLTEEGVLLVRKIQNYFLEDLPENPNKLMTQKTETVISYSGMRTAIGRACKKAGIPHYAIHQLRHTFATSLLNAGVSLPALQKLLGHKTIHMTLRYAEIMPITVRTQFFAAINKAIEQYDIPVAFESEFPNPMQALADLILLVEKKRQESQDPKSDKKKLLLLQKLRRIQVELAQFV